MIVFQSLVAFNNGNFPMNQAAGREKGKKEKKREMRKGKEREGRRMGRMK